MRCKNLLTLVLLLLSARTLRAGTLWTLDGQMVDGDTKLLPSNEALVTPPQGNSLRVPLNQVLHLSLNRPRLGDPNTQIIGSLADRLIGNVKKPADALFVKGVYTFKGDGLDVGGSADHFHFFSQGFLGNGELIVRVNEIGRGNVRAGLMIRENVKNDAPYAAVMIDSSGEITFRFRTRQGQRSTLIAGGQAPLPVYLRLVRINRQCYGYKSLDGKVWNLVGRIYSENKLPQASDKDNPLGINLSQSVLAGIAFAGGTEPPPGLAAFEDLQVREQLVRQTDQTVDTPAPAEFLAAPADRSLKGVLLRTGTFLSGATLAVGPKEAIRLRWRNQDYPLQLPQLARYHLQTLPLGVLAHLPPAASGVVTSSGDFMDGDISQISNGQVEVSNVTLGLSTYRLSGDAQAVIFREADAAPAGLCIRRTDGSRLIIRSLKLAADTLTADDYLLGPVTLPVGETLSLQCGPDRALRLLTLHPFKVVANPGQDITAVSCFDPGSLLWLTAGNVLSEEGILAPAEAAVHYRLPPGVQRFCCRIGVPDRLPEKTVLRFIVEADGKPLFRSNPMTNRDLPLAISIPLSHASTLVLRTEQAGDRKLTAAGLWGDPFLVRESASANP